MLSLAFSLSKSKTPYIENKIYRGFLLAQNVPIFSLPPLSHWSQEAKEVGGKSFGEDKGG